VQKTLKIVDYVYFMSDGAIVAHGTPEEIRNSNAPFVHQFVWGEIDGPLPFHLPGASYARDLALETARA
jgi:phospholipid/cholesterol/gamma-HCH transport system ATP-binding protein